jgi:hypothetical protein
MMIVMSMCIMACMWIFIVVPDSEYFEHKGEKRCTHLMREVIFCKGKAGLSKNHSLKFWKSLDPMKMTISYLRSEKVRHSIWEFFL